jgi:cysteine desulfurase/selenocysteine lyase
MPGERDAIDGETEVSGKNLAAKEISRGAFDAHALRKDFPILALKINDNPLVYLDSTASAQKPTVVIEALERYYLTECSNVHRGVHELSAKATADYEGARDRIQAFIGAADRREIIYTRGTTESINLVASSYGDQHLFPGEEVLITEMEHHSNIVPWQMLCERRDAKLKVVPVDDAGQLDMAAFEKLLGPLTRIVAVTHVSNVLGTRNPVERIAEMAHAVGAVVLLDGAQGVVHEPIHVGELGCDFYAFSGHKLYGPTGIGILYGKAAILESMRPYQGGGDMIRTVRFERTTYNDLPCRFEAGTPHIAGAIGMGAAVDYLSGIGMERITAAERELTAYALQTLEAMPEVELIGTARERSGVISFNLKGIHPHDVGTVLDHQGIAVRAGHHCAQPLMERFGVPATVRASLACYSIPEEIDALAAGLRKTLEVFGP